MEHNIVADAQFLCAKLQPEAIVLATLSLVMRMSGADHEIQYLRMFADDFRQSIDHILDTLAR